MENQIDVQEIMEKIREEIKEKGYKESDLSFTDIEVKERDEILTNIFDKNEYMHSLSQANAYVNLGFYSTNIGNGIKAVIKKIIRKLIAPIMLPVCERQETYNASSVRTLNQMNLYIRELETKISDLEKEINKLKK
jgi:hypothetical protein